MPRVSGVDFLDFDSLLNDEELLARKNGRQFVDEHVVPIIEKHNRESDLPDAAGAKAWGVWDFLGRALKDMAAQECPMAYGLVMARNSSAATPACAASFRVQSLW